MQDSALQIDNWRLAAGPCIERAGQLIVYQLVIGADKIPPTKPISALELLTVKQGNIYRICRTNLYLEEIR